MFKVSEECKKALEGSGRHFTASFFVGGKEYKDILTYSIENGSTADGVISIGDTVSACLKMMVVTDDMLDGEDIVLYTDVLLDDKTTERIEMGHFKICTSKAKGSAIEVTASGPIKTFFETGYFSSLSYPAKAIDILKEIASITGVVINISSFDTSLIVKEKPEGYTCREILGYIAAMYGTFATEERDGSISLKWYDLNTTDIFADKISEPEVEQKTFKVSKLVCKTSDDTELSKGSGIGITISNPLMTEEAMNIAWSNIEGYTYQPASIDIMSADPCIDVWDSFMYEGRIIICAKYTLNFDGGIQATISSEGISETEESYKGPMTKQMERYYADLLILNRAMINKLDVNEADIRYLKVDQATVIEANIKKAVVGSLEADFANVKLSNIDVADIGKFFAKSGILENALIIDGSVTGTLNGVKINADDITSGTISTDRLLLKGKDGLVYEINALLGNLSIEELSKEEYEKAIDGSCIVKKSITAEQVAAGSITSKEIDVEELFAQDITATGKITGLNLVSTTIDTPGFKVDENGKFDAISGVVGKFNIDNGILKCEATDTNENEIGVVMSNTNTLFGNVYTTTLGSNGIKIESTQQGATLKNNYVGFNDKQIELLGVLPTAGTPQYKAQIRTQLGNAADERGLIIECEYGVQVKNGFLADVIETTSGANLDSLSTKVKNGALRINNHFSGITKSVGGDKWSTTIGTIAGTTKGEAILYAEGTFSPGTYRKFIEIRKNGNRIARQECAYTTNNTTNAISICTISTVAPNDVFTAYVYNGSNSTKEITNCIFRMVQIGTINQ